MPGPTELTIKLTEAESARIIAALCEVAGLAPTPANAKRALVAWIKSTVDGQEETKGARQAREAVKPVEGVE